MSIRPSLSGGPHSKLGFIGLPQVSIFVALAFSLPLSSHAGILDDFDNLISYDWEGAQQAWRSGDWDLYLSGYIWHLHFAYTEKQLSHLNSQAWGGGLGRSIIDKYGNLQGLWFMAFSDSHHHGEFNGGYIWIHPWYLEENGANFGLGYTLFVFSRRDIGNYVPFPAALPVVSAGYGRLRISATYIPKLGSIEQGNTVYAFATLRL